MINDESLRGSFFLCVICVLLDSILPKAFVATLLREINREKFFGIFVCFSVMPFEFLVNCQRGTTGMPKGTHLCLIKALTDLNPLVIRTYSCERKLVILQHVSLETNYLFEKKIHFFMFLYMFYTCSWWISLFWYLFYIWFCSWIGKLIQNKSHIHILLVFIYYADSPPIYWWNERHK